MSGEQVAPPEPATVSTVVTGWNTEGDDRPEAMYVFVLTGRDSDGDGQACWQQPGERAEFRWSEVLESTRHGRRIILPSDA
jgi:hypothetical protein